MSYTPMYKGQTGPDWTPTITYDGGSPAVLTGSTNFVLAIKGATSQQDKIGGGVVTPSNLASGQISYAWGANDTAVEGSYTLQFQWTTATGKLQMTDPVPWVVKPV